MEKFFIYSKKMSGVRLAWWDNYALQMQHLTADNAVFDMFNTQEFKDEVEKRIQQEAALVVLDEAALEKEYAAAIDAALRQEVAQEVKKKVTLEKVQSISKPLRREEI